MQPAAPREDTPELSAFLRNSTIPHLVRRRDVPQLEPHRQSPAKILVSCLRAWRSERGGWTGQNSQRLLLLLLLSRFSRVRLCAQPRDHSLSASLSEPVIRFISTYQQVEECLLSCANCISQPVDLRLLSTQ